MSYVPLPDPTLRDLLRTLHHYRWRWIITTAVMTGLALLYALFGPRTWEAAQAVLVRDAVSPHPEIPAPGEFRYEDEMKTRQETILQVATSRPVLHKTLEVVGPAPDEADPEHWPSDKAVETLREALTVAPPNGAEFGKTQVFYLRVKDSDPERAVALVAALSDALRSALNELRATTAESVIAELDEAVALSQAALDKATQRLSSLETQAGLDLIALRMLHQSPTGESDLYRTLTTTQNDLNRIRAVEGTHNALRELLQNARKNPEILLSAPRELLDRQPTLARLTLGLSEARLKVASLAGRYTDEDPRLKTARNEEQALVQGIFQELDGALQGVQAATDVATGQRESLEKQVADLHARIERLAGLRAPYANAAEQVERRRELLAESERNLAAARASLAAASTSGLLTTLDQPDAGTRPIGPGRTMIVLIGLVGGLLAGMGLVFLTAPIQRATPLPGERALAEFLAGQNALLRRRVPDAATAAAESPANGHHVAAH